MIDGGDLRLAGVEAGTFAIVTIFRGPSGATVHYREVIDDETMPVAKTETVRLLRSLADRLEEIVADE